MIFQTNDRRKITESGRTLCNSITGADVAETLYCRNKTKKELLRLF
ncbi:MAG: hypothetical protein IKC05_05795 [Lentisphaeria bacterium]|nr:hypothetical protein [Lentisphaeria bacterium]